MAQIASIAEVNIHLRARAQDKALIDQAAELIGANRSQFMLASALNAAKDILLDQTNIGVDSAAFQKIMDMLDAEPTAAQKAGMQRLVTSKGLWSE